jgi:hypothetical protein
LFCSFSPTSQYFSTPWNEGFGLGNNDRERND